MEVFTTAKQALCDAKCMASLISGATLCLAVVASATYLVGLSSTEDAQHVCMESLRLLFQAVKTSTGEVFNF